jgi:hypothetical protein
MHKLYIRLSAIHLYFLINFILRNLYGSSVRISNTRFQGLVSEQQYSSQNVYGSERPQSTSTHRQLTQVDPSDKNYALALPAVTPTVYFLSLDHTFDANKRDVSDMRSR